MKPEPPPETAAPREREESRSRPDQPSPAGSAGRWAGGIVLALVLYVLSFGPAVKLHKAGYLSEEVGIVYVPLGWVLETADPDEKYLYPALEWYVVTVWGEHL